MKTQLLISAFPAFLSTLMFVLGFQNLQAQVPQKFGYQAIARDAGGTPLANTAISVRLNINNLTAGGTTLYSERHDVTTNAQGLFSVEAGAGTVLSGSFAAIDWSTGDKFLETSLDSNGATGGYTFIVMGATQLISVPYSLNSNETRWVKVGSLANMKVGNSGFNMTGGSNTAIGYNALNSNTTGSNNTAIGKSAMSSNTIGEFNTAVGLSSLFFNSEGQSNTAIGVDALFYNTTGNFNTATGYRALYANNIGQNNTANGYLSLYSNTSGNYNTATGVGALRFNTEGSNNTATGKDALYSNTTGIANTATGVGALYANTEGESNTANGFYALYDNTTGSRNTASGESALSNNTIGYDNTAIGERALIFNTEGFGNTAIGKRSLYFNTTGNNNTANGSGALYNNTTGFDNTANGVSALASNTIGYENTAIGRNALNANTIGYENTATGRNALTNNTEGYANTANGFTALVYNDTGYNNTATGVEALYFNTSGYGNSATGLNSLRTNTEGDYNSAVGVNSLFNNITGNLNSALGYNAYPVANALSNYTGIGYFTGSGSSTSNMVEIGNTSISVIRGQVLPTTYSDARIKDNITSDVPGLSFITKLRPVTYNLNIHRQNQMMYGTQKPDTLDWEGKYDIEKIKMTGFIAQEVDRAAQEVNYNFSGIYQPKNDNDLYGLSYSAFVVPLVKAVQEQQTLIEELKTQNTHFQQKANEVDVLKVENQQIKSELEKIKSILGVK